MSTATAPLTRRPLEQLIAEDVGLQVSVGEFLERVAAVSERLPDVPLLFNLCRDRLHFLIAFCAIIAAGRTNVLPPNARPATLASLQRALGGRVACLHDGEAPPDAPLNHDLRRITDRVSGPIPHIPLSHRCSLSFTSGSTGTASEVHKFWRTVIASTQRNAAPYLPSLEQHCSLLATVPAQHMYGMETSIFLPLFADVAIHPGKPLFPADVARALAAIAAPRVLVTTPLHARALVASETGYPSVARILCATAPLERSLARDLSERFAAPVQEIYGCTEAGTLAIRETARTANWTLLEGFQRDLTEEGMTRIHADDLPEPVTLQDRLAWSGPRHFELQGRASDMINIAGKRGSLLDLNQRLLSLPGVDDGVIFDPGEGSPAPRLAALVVAPGMTREAVLTGLRAYVDDAFLPRPLLLVEALPRDAVGKLPRQRLIELYRDKRVR